MSGQQCLAAGAWLALGHADGAHPEVITPQSRLAASRARRVHARPFVIAEPSLLLPVNCSWPLRSAGVPVAAGVFLCARLAAGIHL